MKSITWDRLIAWRTQTLLLRSTCRYYSGSKVTLLFCAKIQETSHCYMACLCPQQISPTVQLFDKYLSPLDVSSQDIASVLKCHWFFADSRNKFLSVLINATILSFSLSLWHQGVSEEIKTQFPSFYYPLKLCCPFVYFSTAINILLRHRPSCTKLSVPFNAHALSFSHR